MMKLPTRLFFMITAGSFALPCCDAPSSDKPDPPSPNLETSVACHLVLAVLIPRSEFAAGKLRWELDHPDDYFLFGEYEDGAKPIVEIS